MEKFWVRVSFFDPSQDCVVVREFKKARSASVDTDKCMVLIEEDDCMLMVHYGTNDPNVPRLITFERDSMANRLYPEEWEQMEKECIDMLRNGQKIPAIKRHRELTGKGLKEAKQWVDDMAAKMDRGELRIYDDEIPF